MHRWGQGLLQWHTVHLLIRSPLLVGLLLLTFVTIGTIVSHLLLLLVMVVQAAITDKAATTFLVKICRLLRVYSLLDEGLEPLT